MSVTREIWEHRDGMMAYDMHVHTSASDAFTTPKALAHVLQEKQISCAVTDHNVISGVKKVLEYTPVIPGIEVSAAEGPHILIYFERYADLEDYFNRHIKGRHTMCPHLAIRADTEQIIAAAKDAGGLVVAAHPYGYGIAVRGVMKGIMTGVLPPSAGDRLDGLEVLCAGLRKPYNLAAEQYATEHGLCMTGGSDAHVPWDVGLSVAVSSCDAGPAEMLEEIRAKRTRVVGMERTFARNAVQGLCMTPKYIPWLIPLFATHMQQHIFRMKKMLAKKKL
ncbi:MAG TPA: hypothetical protein O0X27_04515 [Methanocorpusculum sp.]|nr:hypothetical protein [Methanocorpusculum sp.]